MELCIKMARFARQNSGTLFKLVLAFSAIWFILNYSSSYFLIKERWKRPMGAAAYSAAVHKKTANIFNIIRGKLPAKDSAIGGCMPKGITVPKSTNTDKVLCKRVPPTREACSMVKEIFGNMETATCGKDRYDICEIKEISIGDYHVHCQPKICKGSIQLGITDEKTGSLEWVNFTSASKLEDKIAEIVHPTYDKKHFGFCFIRCKPVKLLSQDESRYQDYSDMEFLGLNLATQLLILPPQVKIKKPDKIPKLLKDSPTDINLILLDSASRHHFYRSMPNTLKTFENINTDSKMKAKVFDFKLFQTIKARTYESINALFSGEVNLKEKPYGIYDLPYRPLAYEKTLKPLKEAGYRTLALEDLCWSWEWGLPKDLLVLNKSSSTSATWKRLNKAFEKAGIDDTDVSLASCEIFKANGQKDPFHRLPKICFNGQHMNEYFLNYLGQYQRKLSVARENFFTFYANDDSHEEWGSRLRTLDAPLSKHIEESLLDQNMITIIFSDHGNTYGTFVENTLEGRLELYHASLFMIVPDGVREKLGPDKVAALAANQNRLVSLLDLHYTIQSLIPNKKLAVRPDYSQYLLNPDGLFSLVSPNRTCSNMPRLNPHLCICQDYETEVANTSANALIADFALGSLNNVIQKQFYSSHPKARRGFGACQRLVAQRFTNVHKRNEPDGSVVTRLDLQVDFMEPNGIKTREIFFAMVKSTIGANNNMKLVSTNRMSRYGRFEKCADKGVRLSLCVCSLHLPKPDFSSPLYNKSFVRVPRTLQTESEIYPVDEDGCLIFLVRRYKVGASFDGMNTCSNRRYRMVLSLKLTNMDSSNLLPVDEIIEPGGYTFLTVVRQRALNLSWKWQYSIEYGYEVV